MKLGQFVEYKGFVGSIELDTESKFHFGSIQNIEDSVSYHASNLIELEKQFHKAVDNYIEIHRK